MRWTRKRPNHRPRSTHHVDESVFASAADALGFTLDDAQSRAARTLATGSRSVYVWGPVGRGKSWLTETYFAALPTDRKMRVHFHEFFRDLHVAIRKHDNDLGAALDDLLRGLECVCFDEFHVHDPADGRFLARLLPALLDRDVRVVLTSNYAPHSLLPNPLFHGDFVPTIELIERTMSVVRLDGPLDYRTLDHRTSSILTGFAAGWWVRPGDPEQVARLGLRPPDPGESTTLAPAGHPIHAKRAADGQLWIDFADLCEETTAPVDYLALARDFRHWVIDGVPDLRSTGREPAQRFANVVDVLYDRDVTPVFLAVSLTALAGTTGLTDTARLPVDIARVASRLGRLRRLEVESPGSGRGSAVAQAWISSP